MTPEQAIKLIQLKAKYSALSEIEECFPKNSKHKAVLLIRKNMNELLYQIELIKTFV